MRVVIDTNVWISSLLRPSRDHADAVAALWEGATVLYPAAVLDELIDVLGRKKIRRYVSPQSALDLVARFTARAELVEITETIKASRDPDDDKFLELAVAGKADMIVTGDTDLLDLHSFRDIAILSPREALSRLPDI